VDKDSKEIKRLIESVLSGNRGAFVRLVEMHKRLVSHMVFRMIQNEADREDLCQEVFMRVYDNLGSFRFQSKLSTWIGSVAFNTCANYLEKKRVPLYQDLGPGERTIDDCVDNSLNPDEIVERGDISSIIRREIDGLPIKYRTVITLYHLEEMSYKEIGSIANLPEGTVKSYLFRARRLLKEKLLSKFKTEDLWERSI